MTSNFLAIAMATDKTLQSRAKWPLQNLLEQAAGEGHFVLVNFFGGLAAAHHVKLALAVQHQLRGFGKRVVVLGGHGSAVRARAFHYQQIAALGLWKSIRKEKEKKGGI